MSLPPIGKGPLQQGSSPKPNISQGLKNGSRNAAKAFDSQASQRSTWDILESSEYKTKSSFSKQQTPDAPHTNAAVQKPISNISNYFS